MGATATHLQTTELAQTLRTWATLLPPDADPLDPPPGFRHGLTVPEDWTADAALRWACRVLEAWPADVVAAPGHYAYVYADGAYAGHVARPHGWTVYVRVGAPRHGRRITGLSRRGKDALEVTEEVAAATPAEAGGAAGCCRCGRGTGRLGVGTGESDAVR